MTNNMSGSFDSSLKLAKGVWADAIDAGVEDPFAYCALRGLTPTSPLAPEDEKEMIKTCTQPAMSFKPFPMFFYGSLQSIPVLIRIAGLTSQPELHDATISGWRPMMWGPYPTLVPADKDAVVQGKMWMPNNFAEVRKLESYETNAYTVTMCEIRSGEKVHTDGRVFVWADSDDCGELQEGAFDLTKYEGREGGNQGAVTFEQILQRLLANQDAWAEPVGEAGGQDGEYATEHDGVGDKDNKSVE